MPWQPIWRQHAERQVPRGIDELLMSVGLVERMPALASRRDHYRLRDNAWAVLYTNQNEVLAAMQRAAEAGVAEALSGASRTTDSHKCATSTISFSARFCPAGAMARRAPSR
jgi:hypothetical protein